MMTQRMTTGVYDLDNVGFTGVSVVTNAVSTTAFRGAGRPEAAVAIERMVDRFAAEIGMDPAEVRRRNFVPRFTEPYTTGIGTTYDVGDYAEALERALRAAGYDELRAEQAARRAAGDPVALGIGIAVYVEITAGVQGPEFGAVEVLDDGGLLVRSGATPYGQGHETTWAMIVADRTGVPIEQIEVVHGDTDEIRSGGLTVGSRSVQIGGAAVAEATDLLVDAARKRAADLLEAAVDDVVLDDELRSLPRRRHAGPHRHLGRPRRRATQGPLAADTDFMPKMPTFPFGTHVAVVEVDTETGHVRLRQLVAVDDAGTLINPLLAEGQVHGGIAQGVAQALLEEVHLRRGRPAQDHQLRRLPGDLGAPSCRRSSGPHGDADLGQRARRQGRRRVGHDRRHPRRVQRGDRRPGHLGVRHLETPAHPRTGLVELRAGWPDLRSLILR